MAGEKFLKQSSGNIVEQAATQAGGGGNENKIPSLGADGLLALTMMPVGIGPNVKTVKASEALAAGDWINLYLDTTVKARKADATAAGKECNGFVLAAADNGADVVVYLDGMNNQLASLTLGATYFLSTTPGAGATVPPSGSGNIVQKLGKSVSATEIEFAQNDFIVLA